VRYHKHFYYDDATMLTINIINILRYPSPLFVHFCLRNIIIIIATAMIMTHITRRRHR